MKKMMSIAAVALMMAGSSAFACSSCGCSADKDEKAKSGCSSSKECSSSKSAETNKSAATEEKGE